MDLTEKTASSELIYDGKVVHLYRDTVLLPDGKYSVREYVKHVGAVCVIALTDQNEILLERQYRYAVGKTLTEIPAGKRDSEEEDWDKAAEYADKIERKDGVALYQDFYEMAKIAGASYEELAGTYPVFEGTAVPVKKLSVIGEYLMYNGIVGMFMPITGEAGVPGSVPVVPLGFTMCHEAGHRLGLAGEEEANFAAFLACIYNKDVRFLYSGYYNAFSYCFSALYRADSERAKSLLESHQDDPGVKLLLKDRQDTSEYYRKYDSPLQEVSDQINDTYLKTFSQKEGIRSYGMVVDYMIAWHLKNLD